MLVWAFLYAYDSLKVSQQKPPLMVHKIEKFFGSDFEFCVISYSYAQILSVCKKHFLSGHIGGDTIIPRSLRLSRIEFRLV
jgi:hypothetical protein